MSINYRGYGLIQSEANPPFLFVPIKKDEKTRYSVTPVAGEGKSRSERVMRTFYLLTRFDIFATSLKELFMIFVDRVVRKDGAVDNLLPRFKEQKYLILSVTRFLPSLV